ncbi:hypothetical protein Cni_G19805 [Canna indica]|uniref:Uncharacterized protein n=1 Tax=Canna indica TaxID=4628 RepID=A0AAQ3KMR3_9LILI|nr:hypothetical protein Cni_G19805 [Canna indica]
MTNYYTLLDNRLYKRGLSRPLLKCVAQPWTTTIMAEVHDSICSNHIGGRLLAAKIL